MYDPSGVKTSPEFPVPAQMKAWVLGGPDELFLHDKPTPIPGRAEVLVRIDAVAICATAIGFSPMTTVVSSTSADLARTGRVYRSFRSPARCNG